MNVITGASSGIGRATALLAASRSATVVLPARNGSTLAQIAEEIGPAGERSTVTPSDSARAIATGSRFIAGDPIGSATRIVAGGR